MNLIILSLIWPPQIYLLWENINLCMNSYMHYHTSKFPKTSFKYSYILKGSLWEDNVTFPVDFKQVCSHSILFECYSRHRLWDAPRKTTGNLKYTFYTGLAFSNRRNWRSRHWDFPGGSVVKILHLQRRMCEFDPSWGNLRYHVPHCQEHKKSCRSVPSLKGCW